MESKFSANLRILRKRNKLTLEALGKILDVSKSALSDYENGHTFPSLDVCDAICNYFGINLDNLQKLDFAVTSAEELQQNLLIQSSSVQRESPSDFSDRNKQLEFHNKLLHQQIEGLEVQLQLLKQLLDSKSSVITSLQIQIKLLEEKIRG
ncbi:MULTISPECIES: helix-turn-helix transcriptional regulator [Arcicella]|uniref:Helix-turn-helix transcriptional regulator n=1 Tax=Arcicella aquatica TaxID=217141 RepID=A0ABU5QPS6_9BACT|nr:MULTISPECIES: helix-turn-helix transcriptional regulator [Arcicella]MDR6563518.1 transcriptional regulator with XRE-family HTH domain [Arcicella sp. BE51]MDR6813370.1 transcriptional regulator with XRE-family HTH domain [Arcicella sp. BE140]MDR6824683.1 transcriptional regulator with XRE-family HTH domain [Arcicella sp. BE139]MEA5259088.1 helix-turn-helix transcriptional regulator [Arcicella aquatica]